MELEVYCDNKDKTFIYNYEEQAEQHLDTEVNSEGDAAQPAG